MPLSPGTRVGPYEIVSILGAGGMGEVYRARDPRLRRDVAVKALPDAVAADPDRAARFEREAQVLASLNHAHIAVLHGLEEADGRAFLILELVEGETLAQRLGAGRLPLSDALTIARQLADALEAAHERGIVHRDIKPANIALTPDQRVKVLDFGLARTLDRAPRGDGAVTVTEAGTAAGVVLGTAAYMSPEQARGLPSDQRTDIWAFGCVLYEMVTGLRPFSGHTASDIIAGVLERQPDWTRIPAVVPARIQWLIQRCLAKDPRQRLQSIGDARIEIDDTLSDPTRGAATADGTPAPKRERVAWVIAALSLAAVAVMLGAGLFRRQAPAAEIQTYSASVVLPDDIQLPSATPSGRFAISPDGRRLALVGVDKSGRSMLYIRPLSSRIPQPLPGTEGAGFPFWSPNSQSVAFLAGGKLKTVDATGGEVATLADAGLNATGTWNGDDVILFTPRGNSPLFRVPASGGGAVAVTTLDEERGEVQHAFPFFLPDGRRFLYFVVGGKEGRTVPQGVYVGSLEGSMPGKLLIEGVSNAMYANGYVLFLREGVLYAQRFDLDRLELQGQPASVVEHVQAVSPTASETTGAFTVSQTGTLAYQTASRVTSQLTWFDRKGVRGGTIGEPADYVDVALSPDNSRVATSMLTATTRDLWTFDVSRGLGERVTFTDGDDFAPNWSRPDSSHLIYSSLRQGSVHLYKKAATGSGNEALLFSDNLGKFNANPSPDGRAIAYVAGGGIIARSDVWILSVGDKRAQPLLESTFLESQPQISPDGRWLLFMSNKSGRREIYATSFPATGREIQISTDGGVQARWHSNGNEIFYVALDGTLTAVAVDGAGDTFEVRGATPLFKIQPRNSRLDAFPYDVARDGKRFLVNTLINDIGPPISLIVNWPATR
jgi:Tol biopolymer transport system component